MVNLRSIQTSFIIRSFIYARFNKTFDKISVKYNNVILIGNLNYNILDEEKCTPLTNMCAIFDNTNLVKTATCHTKNANPTLIDVILTNKPSYCQNITNFNCGVHNFISFQLKGYVPKLKNIYILYRSFKDFKHEIFLNDLVSEF
jgi:hypothetical protein